MKKFADVRGVQVSSVGSQDMNDELWVKLATEVNRLLAQAGRRRRRDHARHRHDGGDRVLPQPRRQERQAGRPHRLDAAVDVAQRRRSAEHLQRRRRRVRPDGRRAAACWSSPTTTSTARARSPSATPPTSQTFVSPEVGLIGVCLFDDREFSRIAGAGAHDGDAVHGHGRPDAAARRRHLRARRDVARPHRRRRRQRRQGTRRSPASATAT